MISFKNAKNSEYLVLLPLDPSKLHNQTLNFKKHQPALVVQERSSFHSISRKNPSSLISTYEFMKSEDLISRQF